MSKAFWVIETARTTYWDGRKASSHASFSPNIDDAMKFYDQPSAEIARCWLLEDAHGTTHLRSVEHSYIHPNHGAKSMSEYQAVYGAVRSRIHSCDVGSIVESAARQAFDTGNLVPLAQEAITIITRQYERPSAVYRPTISLDGNMYCALYGEDLMAGCAGFGKTMEEAMTDFDMNWWKQKAPTPAKQQS